MKRKQFLLNTGLAAGAITLLNQPLWAKFFTDPSFKMKLIRNDVGVFTERGGTIIYFKSKDGWVVVDSQFPEQASHLIGELKKQSEAFPLLINTHHHGDHTAGNIAFKGLVKNVVAHENSKKNQMASAIKQKNEDKQLYPDITFADTWKHKMGHEKIKAHYFGAGHTNGDAIIHFQHANIAHLGDLLFNRRHPFVDRSAGANMKSWIAVLDKVLATFNNETIFVCGHALDPEKITVNKQDIKAFQKYLGQVLNFAEAEIKAGKSKADFIKNTTIPGNEEWKGDGIERPLTAAYEELTEGK